MLHKINGIFSNLNVGRDLVEFLISSVGFNYANNYAILSDIVMQIIKEPLANIFHGVR